jgi:hypothetical protein
MKNLKMSVAAMLLMVVSFTSAQEKDKMDHSKMNMDSMQMTPEFNNENLANAYEQYTYLKDALVNSNPDEAQTSAKMLNEALEGVDGFDDAKKAANDIAGSNNLESQRKSFSKLGLEMESLLKGNLTSGKIYKDFCPMALEGKGSYWLSSIEEIQNPYYGSKMLSCGKVTEVMEK